MKDNIGIIDLLYQFVQFSVSRNF